MHAVCGFVAAVALAWPLHAVAQGPAAPGPASAAASAPVQVDEAAVLRLAALVTQALPVDLGLLRSLQREPRWPLMDRADRVQPADLACIRSRLMPEVYRQVRLDQARLFAQRHPDRMQDSLRVLELGAAEVFATALATNLQGGGTTADLAKRFPPGHIAAVEELVSGPRHRELRDFMGLPENYGRARPSPSQPSPMQAIALKMVVTAMDQCKVPLTAVQ